MGYVKRTIEDKQIIGSTNIKKLLKWINAEYEVYNDMHSQTGGTIPFGIGILHGRLSKHKSNTKSWM